MDIRQKIYATLLRTYILPYLKDASESFDQYQVHSFLFFYCSSTRPSFSSHLQFALHSRIHARCSARGEQNYPDIQLEQRMTSMVKVPGSTPTNICLNELTLCCWPFTRQINYRLSVRSLKCCYINRLPAIVRSSLPATCPSTSVRLLRAEQSVLQLNPKVFQQLQGLSQSAEPKRIGNLPCIPQQDLDIRSAES